MDRIREMARAWHQQHRAEERARAEQRRQQEERENSRREYQRRYEAEHRDQGRERQRRYVARQLETDPDGYRADRREHSRLYRERHKTELAQKDRDRRRANPTARIDYATQYRETHRDDLRQKRREAYAADPERFLAYNREWKRRERRRIATGLPPRRLHRASVADRKDNDRAADTFFSRPVTTELRARVRRERFTRPEKLTAWNRENDRHRAELGFGIIHADIRERFDRAEARRVAKQVRDYERALASQVQEELRRVREAAEEARLDEIGRDVNARLRPPPDVRHRHHNDPAAPHALPGVGPSSGGPHR